MYLKWVVRCRPSVQSSSDLAWPRLLDLMASRVGTALAFLGLL